MVHWSAGISRRNLDWRAQRTQRQSLTTAEAERKPSTSVMYLTSATGHAENDESATSHAEREGGWERDGPLRRGHRETTHTVTQQGFLCSLGLSEASTVCV